MKIAKRKERLITLFLKTKCPSSIIKFNTKEKKNVKFFERKSIVNVTKK